MIVVALTGTFTQAGHGGFRSNLRSGRRIPVALARQSLAGFDSFVNQAIKDWEVPGVAIAIVKNGEVILAERLRHARRGQQAAGDVPKRSSRSDRAPRRSPPS